MSSRKSRFYVLIPLLAYFLLATSIGSATSITVDEGLHIASGYTILRTGDYRLVEEHPPLIKLWIALPLLPLRDLPDPTTLSAWSEAAQPTTESLPLIHMAQQLLYPYQPTDRWLVPARVMGILLGMLLLAVIVRWAWDLWGERGALLAVVFAALDPNLLAHGAIAGTDLGATTFILLALFVAHRFLRRPTLRRAALTGVVLGLTLTTKLTAALLVPALGIAGLVCLGQAKAPHRGPILRLGLLVIGLTGLTFWGVYGFQVGDVPGVSIPLPAAAHMIPILRLREHTAGGHQAFLWGENSMRGWWWYFPAAFALKTPLPTLLLALGAMLSWAAEHRNVTTLKRWNVQTMFLFPLFYIVSSLLSPLNIGYRHLLPLLPFLYVGLAYLGVWSTEYEAQSHKFSIPNFKTLPTPHSSLLTPHSLLLTAYSFLFAWQLFGLLRVYPHPLTFFNAMAGGAHNGWRYLADSNTDWGQGYKALAHFQETEGIERLRLSAFVFYDPAIYGVHYTALTPLGGDTPAVFPSRFAPPPGDYAISVTPLAGIPLVDPEMYDWFRWRAPDAQIANAFHYYHVTADEVAVHWVAQCRIPVAPLDDAAIAAGFGVTGVRRVDFDCTQSWIIPGSATAGRYVLHGAWLQDTLKSRLHYAAPPATDPFIARRLAALNIVYRQRMYRTEPAFAIYAPAADPAIPSSTAWIARAETAPAELSTKPTTPAPIALEGALTFVGAAAYPQEEGLDVETWWRVTDTAPSRPFSIMGHLLDETGEVKGIADGLGVSPQTWQPGDLIIQRHVFLLPAEDRHVDHVLRTGVYELDDGTRWTVASDPEADALFIAVTAPH
ncbi:MAG TPA: glycosyltransferase family 39 protein [Anaerolineae bacterium]|nr:glycosyltransferase family 39 protein [Anaerolineae bacterium]HQH37221.1 glycosyltransferase family 39 protein [Anaerolineae bacterium]